MRLTLSLEALSPQLSGIGRYSWELSRRLGRQAEIDRLQFYRNGDWVADPAALLQERYQHGASRPWMPRKLSRWIDRRLFAASLFHGPNYFLPPWVESGVITIHDLSVFRYPETHPAARIAAFEKNFTSSLERAALILTDSDTVKGELVADFSLDPSRIVTVPLGVDDRYRPYAAGDSAILARHGLTAGGYALCVSTLEPRKRIPELFAAWAALPASLRMRYPLILVGGGGWSNDAILSCMERAEAEGWARNLGYVPESDLPSLYAGAALFLYPSMYEGFGLPPLEAMAAGVPVLVSPFSCLPETCGDAAAYVEPCDTRAFADEIARCLTDERWRETAKARGIARAKGLNWEECARRTAAAYRMVRS